MKGTSKVISAIAMCGIVSLTLLYYAPSPASADEKFGAIACTRNCMQWAVANNCATREEAEAKAIAECHKKFGSKCKAASWFKNACGALATASNGAWAANWGNDEEEAREKALRRCRENRGSDCSIRCLECTEW